VVPKDFSYDQNMIPLQYFHTYSSILFVVPSPIF
jgi:hypothetical protein